jgi:hypothetical protein
MSTTPGRAAPRGHDGDAHDRGGYGAAGMTRRGTVGGSAMRRHTTVAI